MPAPVDVQGGGKPQRDEKGGILPERGEEASAVPSQTVFVIIAVKKGGARGGRGREIYLPRRTLALHRRQVTLRGLRGEGGSPRGEDCVSGKQPGILLDSGGKRKGVLHL